MSQFDDPGLDDDLFATYRVRELDNEDFYLNSAERIALRASGCSGLLFYMPRNPTSRAMRNIWNRLSEDLAGVNFFAVNASRRGRIMEAFQKVASDEEHPFHLYQLRGFPTILVYREGSEPGISWPQAFYNSDLSYEALLNYFLTLACTSGYREFPVLKEGVIVDEDIIVTDPRGVVDEPISSFEFKSGELTLDDVDDVFFNDATKFEDEFEEEALKLEEQRRIPSETLREYYSPAGENITVGDPGSVSNLSVNDL